MYGADWSEVHLAIGQANQPDGLIIDHRSLQIKLGKTSQAGDQDRVIGNCQPVSLIPAPDTIWPN